MRKAEIEKRKEYIKELQNSMVKAKKELITLEATKDDYVPPLDDLIATEKKWVKYLESEIEIQERLLKEELKWTYMMKR